MSTELAFLARSSANRTAVLSVRRKSSRHIPDTAQSSSSPIPFDEPSAPSSTPPVPPIPSLPATPASQHRIETSTRIGEDPAGSQTRQPAVSPLPSPQHPSLIVKRTKRVPPPSLGLEGAINLDTPTSAYTSRFSNSAGAARLASPGFPSPGSGTAASGTGDRPRYVLEVAPLSRTSSSSSSHKVPAATPLEAPEHTENSSMSMLRTPTASSIRTASASSHAPSGYGYGGEYNAAWAEKDKDSPRVGTGGTRPAAPVSPGLSPYRQPDGDDYASSYSYAQEHRGAGASRTSSFSSAQRGNKREMDGDDRIAYNYALRVA